MRRIWLSIVLLISCITNIQAAIIVSDPFTDGDRTQGSDPLDVEWYEFNSSTTSTVNWPRPGIANTVSVTTTPLINSATLRLRSSDLIAFLERTGHPPLIVDLPVPPNGQNG